MEDIAIVVLAIFFLGATLTLWRLYRPEEMIVRLRTHPGRHSFTVNDRPTAMATFREERASESRETPMHQGPAGCSFIGFLLVSMLLLLVSDKPELPRIELEAILQALEFLVVVALLLAALFWIAKWSLSMPLYSSSPGIRVVGIDIGRGTDEDGIYGHLAGTVNVPRRVYENDSRNIIFKLTQDEPRPEDSSPSKPCNLANARVGANEFLEVELLGAALSIEGEKKQQQSLGLKELYYYWNCHFEKSGDHTIGIVLRRVRGGWREEIDHMEYLIRVVKLDHLTQRQVWLLGSVSAAITAILAIMKFIQGLGP